MLAMGDSAPREGADAMTFVGCDLHTRMQQVAMLDTRTGEVSEVRQLREERAILSKAAAWFARETNTIPAKDSSS